MEAILQTHIVIVVLFLNMQFSQAELFASKTKINISKKKIFKQSFFVKLISRKISMKWISRKINVIYWNIFPIFSPRCGVRVQSRKRQDGIWSIQI